jgi:hypothetical protein
MVDKSKELAQSLTRLQSSQLIAFSSACADAVAPVALALGKKGAVEISNKIRELPWNEELSVENAAQLLKSLHSLPDLAVDDSYLPTYYAARALGVMGEKLNAILAEAPISAARHACNGTLDIASDFDYICGEAGEQPNLESAVESEVAQLIELLNHSAPDDDRVDLYSQEIGQRLITVLPTVAKVMQWETG